MVHAQPHAKVFMPIDSPRVVSYSTSIIVSVTILPRNIEMLARSWNCEGHGGGWQLSVIGRDWQTDITR